MPVLLQWYRHWVMCTKYYGLQPKTYKFYRCSILIERELKPPTLIRTLSRNVTAHPTDELTASIKADRGGYPPEGPRITIQYGLRCTVISCVCTLFSPPFLPQFSMTVNNPRLGTCSLSPMCLSAGNACLGTVVCLTPFLLLGLTNFCPTPSSTSGVLF